MVFRVLICFMSEGVGEIVESMMRLFLSWIMVMCVLSCRLRNFCGCLVIYRLVLIGLRVGLNIKEVFL